MSSELHELLYYIDAQDEGSAAGNGAKKYNRREAASGSYPSIPRTGRRANDLHRHNRVEETPDDTETVQ